MIFNIFYFFSNGGIAAHNSKYREGRGQIWLDRVECTPDLNNIEQCKHNGWGHHDCNHKEDAGVLCISPGTFNSHRIYKYEDAIFNCRSKIFKSIFVTKSLHGNVSMQDLFFISILYIRH